VITADEVAAEGPAHARTLKMTSVDQTEARNHGCLRAEGQAGHARIATAATNGRVLGAATVQVVNGVAEAPFTVAFFGRGSFTFDAQYLGSSQFQGSTSNAVTVNVF
jgi:hypothetical protein